VIKWLADRPVPGSPAVTLVPFLPTLTLSPGGPNEKLKPDLLMFSQTQGSIWIRF
jgi:hypothetical protein